jgi:ferrous-iron efflux pump FieF
MTARADDRVTARPATVDAESARLMKLATTASVIVALSLVVVKAFAWMATDSVALLSSLVDSALDVAASLVNLLAVRHALTPADREHRFGHGKAEALAGLGQSTFIAGSALFLVVESVRRLMAPTPVEQGVIGLAVMAFSIVVTLGLVMFQRRVIARTKSVAISADSLHFASDLMVNAGVIVALVLATWFGLELADPVIALAIAAYILWGAWEVASGSYDILMDRELADDERKRVREIVLEHPDVLAMHDLRTRTSGSMSFIQLHLELDGDMSLRRAHEIADEVEARLRAAFPGAEVLIHQDPAGVDEPRAAFRR